MNRAVPEPSAERPERPASTLPVVSKGDPRSPVSRAMPSESGLVGNLSLSMSPFMRPYGRIEFGQTPTYNHVMVVNGPGAAFANASGTHRGLSKAWQIWRSNRGQY